MILFRPASRIGVRIGARADLFEFQVSYSEAGDVLHISNDQAVGGGRCGLLHPDQVTHVATQPLCLETNILRNPRAHFVLGISPARCDVEGLELINSTPCINIKPISKDGLHLLEGTAGAVELVNEVAYGFEITRCAGALI
jgi:hypothetical protein